MVVGIGLCSMASETDRAGACGQTLTRKRFRVNRRKNVLILTGFAIPSVCGTLYLCVTAPQDHAVNRYAGAASQAANGEGEGLKLRACASHARGGGVMRNHFDQQLHELRNAVLMLGSQVGEELATAMIAYETLDLAQAEGIIPFDRRINAQRFRIEEDCVGLIVMQQPAARDLRAILTALHMTVDLERMGDQAKRIVKTIPYIQQQPLQVRPATILEMASKVRAMHEQAMKAYADDDVDLARSVGKQDDGVDELYASVFKTQMEQIATSREVDTTEAAYEVLRLAGALERCGDLATNLAERVVYFVTGEIEELNVDTPAIEEVS